MSRLCRCFIVSLIVILIVILCDGQLERSHLCWQPHWQPSDVWYGWWLRVSSGRATTAATNDDSNDWAPRRISTNGRSSCATRLATATVADTNTTGEKVRAPLVWPSRMELNQGNWGNNVVLDIVWRVRHLFRQTVLYAGDNDRLMMMITTTTYCCCLCWAHTYSLPLVVVRSFACSLSTQQGNKLLLLFVQERTGCYFVSTC